MEAPKPGAASGPFLAALGFLTRVPVAVEKFDLSRAYGAFAVVGVWIGAVAAIIYGLALQSGVPPLTGAFLAISAAVLMTGGLHEDGLADFADALGARGGRDKALEIMRDSRIGSYGVLALLLITGMRVSALSGLDLWQGLAGLVSAAALSRAALPVIAYFMAPARSDGLGAGAGRPTGAAVMVAVLSGLLAAACIANMGVWIAAVGGGVLGAAMVAILAKRRLGGYTGDVLGAAQQVAEAGALTAMVAAWTL
ncbi:MAG: adenosylcobinamide-GDP ribazoletransferase [Magnetospiraceae bacterium]